MPLGALVAVVALLFGIWVGGAPSESLPGPVRDALVGDSDTAVVKEAIDRVHDTYYRKIPESALADDAIDGVVERSATASRTTSIRAVQALQGPQNPSSRASA